MASRDGARAREGGRPARCAAVTGYDRLLADPGGGGRLSRAAGGPARPVDPDGRCWVSKHVPRREAKLTGDAGSTRRLFELAPRSAWCSPRTSCSPPPPAPARPGPARGSAPSATPQLHRGVRHHSPRRCRLATSATTRTWAAAPLLDIAVHPLLRRPLLPRPRAHGLRGAAAPAPRARRGHRRRGPTGRTGRGDRAGGVRHGARLPVGVRAVGERGPDPGPESAPTRRPPTTAR
ncbi:hypothetical protein LT493_11900 [Streptomyces tricolor]|nr:hypothetical protein [Streptomyces tricolor]